MIRQAEKKDIEAIVPLIMMILRDMELPLLAELGEDKVSDMMSEACLIEGYRYYYKRAIVLTNEQEKVCGVAFGYLHRDEKEIDQAWDIIMNRYGYIEQQPLFSDKETFPGEWYLDTLVVDPSEQGHGYGTQLLEAVGAFAIQAGSHIVGLNVDVQNPRARQLYERVGFEAVGEMMISNHCYTHMQKEV